MSDSTNPPVNDSPVSGDDGDTKGASGSLTKEHESGGSEEKILEEIIKTSEAVDDQAERQVSEAISEARQARPEPKIPQDLADAGVKAPLQEAEEVIKKGPTIKLPITEESYQKGLHQKIVGAVVNNTVVGVSSLFALAAWVGRMIKIAHKHAMKVVFRQQGGGS